MYICMYVYLGGLFSFKHVLLNCTCKTYGAFLNSFHPKVKLTHTKARTD